jgi:hypothetical protein
MNSNQLKQEKKKSAPIQSGKKSAKSESTSRSGSRNQEAKTPDRVKSPVQLSEAQIKMKSVFSEKAHMNVSFVWLKHSIFRNWT